MVQDTRSQSRVLGSEECGVKGSDLKTPESALLVTLASIAISAGLATAQETARPLPRWVVT